MEKEVLLRKFILQFIRKSRKRRSHKNELKKITWSLNGIFRAYFDFDQPFEELEIAQALQDCGFEFMRNSPEEFTWERLHKSSALLGSEETYVNIKSQDLIDLRMSYIDASEKSVKSDTMDKYAILRDEILRFRTTIPK